MQNSFSILDCILDQNKAKLNHSLNSTFHICLYDNFLLNCWTLSCIRRSINFDLFVNKCFTISSLKATNNYDSNLKYYFQIISYEILIGIIHYSLTRERFKWNKTINH
jgi:hypothetical protein